MSPCSSARFYDPDAEGRPLVDEGRLELPAGFDYQLPSLPFDAFQLDLVGRAVVIQERFIPLLTGWLEYLAQPGLYNVSGDPGTIESLLEQWSSGTINNLVRAPTACIDFVGNPVQELPVIMPGIPDKGWILVDEEDYIPNPGLYSSYVREFGSESRVWTTLAQVDESGMVWFVDFTMRNPDMSFAQVRVSQAIFTREGDRRTAQCNFDPQWFTYWYRDFTNTRQFPPVITQDPFGFLQNVNCASGFGLSCNVPFSVTWQFNDGFNCP